MDKVRSTLDHLRDSFQPSPSGFERLAARRERRARVRRAGAGVMALALTAGLSVGLWTVLQKSPPPSRPTDPPRPAYPPRPTVTSAFEDLPQEWTELPPPPEVRTGAAMVWTGDRLITWGGYVYKGGGTDVILDDGFVFDARTSRWTPLPRSPLSPRSDPGVAWTGREMLVWGGRGESTINLPQTLPQYELLGDGAAYDPVRRSWRLLPKAPISPRAPRYVWTGREFIVWGTSVRMTTPHRYGAAYDPSTNSWRKIADAPIELTDATAVWTGQEMIVFGATLDQNNSSDTENAIGAAYDPESDTWRPLPDSSLSPQASTAVWRGREMVAWDYEGRSEAYDPAENRWRGLSKVVDPSECYPQSVTTEGYVFGEFCGRMVLLKPGADKWRDISRPDSHPGWGNELVAADPVVLVLGSNIETDEVRMLAYRPSERSRGAAFEPTTAPGARAKGEPRCKAPPFRPAYLPWLKPGEPLPSPRATREGRNFGLTWFKDERKQYDAPYVGLVTEYESVFGGAEGLVHFERTPVRGKSGYIVSVGDPGVGELALTWQEQAGPCGWFTIYLLDRKHGEQQAEEEIKRIAHSLAE
ncbi:MAG: hypothetical protein M3N24_04830 [Actinomycetota bacterium]|nr:hypothetical protein [Actinomycetota bacterium]